MISTDFASNEMFKDAFLSFSLLFTPWNWNNLDQSRDLELEISKLLKLKKDNIFYFLTGRSALLNVLKALDLSENDGVLVQTFTCEAVILPILNLKLIPQYVDIEKETFSMDTGSLIKRIRKNSRVLILQSSFGLTPKYKKEILKLAKLHKLIVIEDLAHGFTNENIKEDTIKLLSFGRSKSFSSVWGGAIICKDKRIAKRIQILNNELKNPSFIFILQALIYKPLGVLIKSTYDIYLGKILHKIIGQKILSKEITTLEKRMQFDESLNKKYPAVFAKLLWLQLKDQVLIRKQREKITNIYSQNFKLNYQGALIRYPVLVKNSSQILRKLASKNIFLGNWYNDVIAPKNLNLLKLLYIKGTCPNTEEVNRQIINLPTLISEKQAKYILKLIHDNS